MKKYLELFINGFDETITDKIKVENKPYIGYSLTEGKLAYTVVPAKEEEPEIDLTIPYVTFTAEEDDSTIGLEKLSKYQRLEYSTDTTTWNTFDTTTNLSLNNGDKVYVRGVLLRNNNSANYTRFKMTGKIAASGNCNALWNYQDLNAPLKNYCGYSLFRNCTSLTAAPELPATELKIYCYRGMFSDCTSLTTAPTILPATTLAGYCYQNMFSGCTALTEAPELPATTLATYCCNYMFKNCTSLTTAPKILPATELADYGYAYMFAGCSSLTTAPELPATTLTYYCYLQMFYECTNLNYIKCLATDISATDCIFGWVHRVSSTGTFVKNPDMNNWTTGSDGIPRGWTVENAVL